MLIFVHCFRYNSRWKCLAGDFNIYVQKKSNLIIEHLKNLNHVSNFIVYYIGLARDFMYKNIQFLIIEHLKILNLF